MTIKTVITDANGLEKQVNEIGWENILQIHPDHSYDGTLFVIIYKEIDKTSKQLDDLLYLFSCNIDYKEKYDDLKQHETDLLKEFVEFAKGEFIKANYCYNDTYLDTMLEMFLEEKK